MSVGTAFFPRTSELNVKMAWGEWAGYYAAAVYADFHDIEYNAIREAVAAIDASPLYKYEIHGRDAGALLDRVFTRDIAKLALHQVYYTPWCDEFGKVIDDGTVTRFSENSYRVTSADPAYRLFKMNGAGLEFDIDDVSETLAALALQGPKSRDVLQVVTGEDWSDVKYFFEGPTKIAGVDVDVTRTGYTGDLGYELWIPADQAVAVWDAIFEAGRAYGIRPAGIRALDVARVEAGLILIEVEYSSSRHAVTDEQRYSPYEIGLGRLVNLNKSEFIGQRALRAEHAGGGPQRRLVGIEIDWAGHNGIEAAFAEHGLSPEVSPMVVRDAIPLFKNGRQVGRATSTAWAPTLKKMIALASVDKQFEAAGTDLQMEWTVEGERSEVDAHVVPTPFLDLPRKRA
jgi:aminomethyltransferase